MDDYPQVYLGDGVYARFDGYQIWLSTQRSDSRTDSVALDPAVYAKLVEYVAKLKESA